MSCVEFYLNSFGVIILINVRGSSIRNWTACNARVFLLGLDKGHQFVVLKDIFQLGPNEISYNRPSAIPESTQNKI